MGGGQANSSESSATPSNTRSSLAALQSPMLPDDPCLCPHCSKSFHPSYALLEDTIKKLNDKMFPPLGNAKPFPIPPCDDPSYALLEDILKKLNDKMFPPLDHSKPFPIPSSHGPVSTFKLDFGPDGQGFIPVPPPVCTESGARDGYETLSRAHQLDLNQHPYPMPDNNNMMPWEMNLGQEGHFAARAGLGAWLGCGPSTAAADADASVGASNGEEDFNENDLVEKLDLTLKL